MLTLLVSLGAAVTLVWLTLTSGILGQGRVTRCESMLAKPMGFETGRF